MRAFRIHITGVVQGVGFRPFVYQVATRAHLNGWVANTSAGVELEIEGDPVALDAFMQALRQDKPPLARIDTVRVQEIATNGSRRFNGFEIRESVPLEGAFQPISPDISICPDCLRELFDPGDRRYRYPFINCTNCGPRFTIIQDIPYDRQKTTMALFDMCPDCAAEYADPLDRRFHAQPVACPHCGPQVWLEGSRSQGSRITGRDAKPNGDDAIRQTRDYILQGAIVAIKGLGGFHLACDATNPRAVEELRRRKLRVDKPFALMMSDLSTVERHCIIGDAECTALESRERPIVLLRRRPESNIAAAVAPGQSTLGVMLPYTPLHYLLFESRAPKGLCATPPGRFAISSPESPVLVMTSGNLSEEPIVTDNDEARERLATLADYLLMHDRPIEVRTDDSVVRVFQEQVYPIRRSRGYAPTSLSLPFDVPPLLATGAELKNTFCLARERYAFLSHHIGDLENYETLRSFEDGIAHWARLFRVQPTVIAYDLHPNYLATRYALDRAERDGIPAIGVQHHHAHIAACMADSGLDGSHPVIGVALDGTGYGEDGTIWGGEILLADYAGFRRILHLNPVPLPGGDRAIREPWRVALAWLLQAGIPWSDDLGCVREAGEKAQRALREQIVRRVNAPLTSSMGRLFDAVAALAGVRQTVNYEGQAAIELEARVDLQETGAYRFEIHDDTIDSVPVIQAVVDDIRSGASIATVAARFHNGVAEMVRRACVQARDRFGVNHVALSGGVWQNMILLSQTVALLRRDNFAVYIHRQVPTNDGGLALGQAVVAVSRVQKR